MNRPLSRPTPLTPDLPVAGHRAGRLATSLAILLACMDQTIVNENLHPSPVLPDIYWLLPTYSTHPFVPLHPGPCSVAAAKRVLVLE